jgi:hypothetical protein
MKKSILYQYGELDCLLYYSKVSHYIKKMLKSKEIATKTILEDGKFIKRGSNSPQLYIEDLEYGKNINENFLKLRVGKHLDEVKEKLTEKQILIWKYFVPRKMINFFYACNNEYGKNIERIFIDIDRQNNSSEQARVIAMHLINIIKEDNEFGNLVKFKPIILWTGSSFHIYLLLKNKVDLNFYNNYLSYGKNKEKSFIIKWAEQISKETKLNVKAGHEREKNAIILDSSNTPPGKLARCPFSLHIKEYNKYDGVSVPLTEKQLENKNLIKKLKKLTPDFVLENIRKYSFIYS